MKNDTMDEKQFLTININEDNDEELQRYYDTLEQLTSKAFVDQVELDLIDDSDINIEVETIVSESFVTVYIMPYRVLKKIVSMRNISIHIFCKDDSKFCRDSVTFGDFKRLNFMVRNIEEKTGLTPQ